MSKSRSKNNSAQKAAKKVERKAAQKAGKAEKREKRHEEQQVVQNVQTVVKQINEVLEAKTKPKPANPHVQLFNFDLHKPATTVDTAIERFDLSRQTSPCTPRSSTPNSESPRSYTVDLSAFSAGNKVQFTSGTTTPRSSTSRSPSPPFEFKVPSGFKFSGFTSASSQASPVAGAWMPQSIKLSDEALLELAAKTPLPPQDESQLALEDAIATSLPSEDEHSIEFELEDAAATPLPSEDEYSIEIQLEDAIATSLPFEDVVDIDLVESEHTIPNVLTVSTPSAVSKLLESVELGFVSTLLAFPEPQSTNSCTAVIVRPNFNSVAKSIFASLMTKLQAELELAGTETIIALDDKPEDVVADQHDDLELVTELESFSVDTPEAEITEARHDIIVAKPDRVKVAPSTVTFGPDVPSATSDITWKVDQVSPAIWKFLHFAQFALILATSRLSPPISGVIHIAAGSADCEESTEQEITWHSEGDIPPIPVEDFDNTPNLSSVFKPESVMPEGSPSETQPDTPVDSPPHAAKTDSLSVEVRTADDLHPVTSSSESNTSEDARTTTSTPSTPPSTAADSSAESFLSEGEHQDLAEQQVEYELLNTFIGKTSLSSFLNCLELDDDGNATRAEICRAFVSLADDEYHMYCDAAIDKATIPNPVTEEMKKSPTHIGTQTRVRLGRMTLYTFLGLVEFGEDGKVDEGDIMEAFKAAAKMEAEAKKKPSNISSAIKRLAARKRVAAKACST